MFGFLRGDVKICVAHQTLTTASSIEVRKTHIETLLGKSRFSPKETMLSVGARKETHFKALRKRRFAPTLLLLV